MRLVQEDGWVESHLLLVILGAALLSILIFIKVKILVLINGDMGLLLSFLIMLIIESRMVIIFGA
jgi:hypothetical protein